MRQARALGLALLSGSSASSSPRSAANDMPSACEAAGEEEDGEGAGDEGEEEAEAEGEGEEEEAAWDRYRSAHASIASC